MELKHTSVHIKYLIHDDFSQVFFPVWSAAIIPPAQNRRLVLY